MTEFQAGILVGIALTYGLSLASVLLIAVCMKRMKRGEKVA